VAANQAAEEQSARQTEGVSSESLLPSLIGQIDSPPLAWTLALCGDARGSQLLADDFGRKFPLDTIIHSAMLPLIRATIELKKEEARGGSGPSSDHIIQLLQPSVPYEAALNFRPTWIRGQAYLMAKNGPQAEAEFKKIVDHRGWDVLS